MAAAELRVGERIKILETARDGLGDWAVGETGQILNVGPLMAGREALVYDVLIDGMTTPLRAFADELALEEPQP